MLPHVETMALCTSSHFSCVLFSLNFIKGNKIKILSLWRTGCLAAAAVSYKKKNKYLFDWEVH